jgi:hypothetical protein
MSALDVSPDRIQRIAVIQRIAIPAKAGTHSATGAMPEEWIPAFAGKAILV